jgi:hypothetical protein
MNSNTLNNLILICGMAFSCAASADVVLVDSVEKHFCGNFTIQKVETFSDGYLRIWQVPLSGDIFTLQEIKKTKCEGTLIECVGQTEQTVYSNNLNSEIQLTKVPKTANVLLFIDETFIRTGERTIGSKVTKRLVILDSKKKIVDALCISELE